MKKFIKILPLTLILLLGFTETANMVTGNWYQQFMPNLNGRNITDIFFLDSLTGWAVTNALNQNPDTTFVLKTINGGDNWVIQYRKIQLGGGFFGLSRIYFLNQNTGYMCGVDNGPLSGYNKTTDGGTTWVSLNVPDPAGNYLSMSILNIDTQWVVTPDALGGGVFRTTNGGVNWQQQASYGSNNPGRVYFFNRNLGFASEVTGQILRMTTNGGDTTFLLGLQQISNNVPEEYKLYQNFPNPFNPVTNIRYGLKAKKFVLLKVFNITGQEIITLVNQQQNAGIFQVDFSGTNYPSGIYFYSLFVNDKLMDTKKMILVK